LQQNEGSGEPPFVLFLNYFFLLLGFLTSFFEPCCDCAMIITSFFCSSLLLSDHRSFALEADSTHRVSFLKASLLYNKFLYYDRAKADRSSCGLTLPALPFHPL